MDISQTSALEAQFPRIAEQVSLLWGNPEMDAFFSRLAVDDRGDRQGFPPEVMSELMFLSVLHSQAYPPKAVAPQYANRSRSYHSGMAFA